MFQYKKPTRHLYVVLFESREKKNKNDFGKNFNGIRRITFYYSDFHEGGKQALAEAIYLDMMGTEGKYSVSTYRCYRKGVLTYNKYGRPHRYNKGGKKPFKLANVEIEHNGAQVIARWTDYKNLEKEHWYKVYKPKFER